MPVHHPDTLRELGIVEHEIRAFLSAHVTQELAQQIAEICETAARGAGKPLQRRLFAERSAR